MRKIEVCFSPGLLHLFDLQGCIVVVVDVLRATSCMVTGLAHGVEAIIPVAKTEECKALQKQGLLAAAEREGSMIPGFDIDNSPFSYMHPDLKGKTIAVTTTNGTQAITQSAAAEQIVIGAFLNLSSVKEYLMQQPNDVLILCAGWKDHFNLEDTLFAGALVHLLKDVCDVSQDAAQAAESLYLTAQADMLTFLINCSHVKRLKNLNITKDIAFCLEQDKYSVIPVMRGNRLVTLEANQVLTSANL